MRILIFCICLLICPIIIFSQAKQIKLAIANGKNKEGVFEYDASSAKKLLILEDLKNYCENKGLVLMDYHFKEQMVFGDWKNVVVDFKFLPSNDYEVFTETKRLERIKRYSNPESLNYKLYEWEIPNEKTIYSVISNKTDKRYYLTQSKEEVAKLNRTSLGLVNNNGETIIGCGKYYLLFNFGEIFAYPSRRTHRVTRDWVLACEEFGSCYLSNLDGKISLLSGTQFFSQLQVL